MQVSKERGIPRYETLQPQYNLYDRAEYETSMEPVCRENGLGVISYFSLASGFLTGKYRSEKDLAGKARSDRVKKYLDERGFRILQALDEVSRQYRSTPATVSLAWLISRPGITAPIASATTVEQLKHLMKAPGLVLEDSAVEKLNQASAY